MSKPISNNTGRIDGTLSLSSMLAVKQGFGKGEMGIGALIIFLAILVVAALAASVFIGSGTSLQQKALITSNEAKEGVTLAWT